MLGFGGEGGNGNIPLDSNSSSFARATAVDHFKPCILGWVFGDRNSKTFEPLWEIVKKWQCYFYVTDAWKVYPRFIPDGDQIVL